MTTVRNDEIDTESLKKEIKQELIKREIMMGMDDDEIDLFELGKVLWKHWRMVLVMPFVVAVIAALYSLTIPNQFKSKATIFVHAKGGSGGMSALLSSLPMAGMLGGLGGGGGAEYLMAYLKSDDMSARIIRQFGVATNPILMGDRPPEDVKIDDLIKKIGNIVNISKDKDGLITVAAETTSATLSADLAAAYLVNLNMYAKGPATQKRVFIEEQLAKVQKELDEAESKFKAYQDKNKLIAIDEQAKAVVESLVKLESSKVESDVALKMQESLLKSMANLPELVRIEGQKVSEEARQKALDKAIGDVEKKLEGIPELALQYARLMRELKVKEKVFETLTTQYEMAKISEAEEGSQFEVIDRPFPAERKSKPSRSLIVILSGITAGMLGVFLAFFVEFLEKRRREEAAKAGGKREA
ncbi:MAG TPA: Wzz/FepE/Etk N-terminal domain-containing protein [Candidatus Ozemobacteraceae bacterium]|nr:Wzz/FepE/Etk N-terminal domain-containing protein [Candidatus Ozemobacteraceae bacterium]